MRIRLLVAYRGDAFHGWQIQSGVPTAEEAVGAAVARMLGGESRKIWGASRTDAGVHAWGQVAAFDDPAARHDERTWFFGLNQLTPRALSIRHVERVDASFHPRHDARGKRYHYDLWAAPYRDPIREGSRLWVRHPLDLEAMRQAAAPLIGTHDFSAFRAAGCQATSPVRHIERIEISELSPGHVRVAIEGSAFLKYMVRILVGTLLEVGTGRREPGWVGDVLRAGDRAAAGPTLPPQALVLVRVDHPEHPWRGGWPTVSTCVTRG